MVIADMYDRLLIAQESREVRILIRALFTGEFTNIDEVEDGGRAIELLSANRYDAVILDLMPSGGMLALEHLARHRPSRLRRVVIVSDGPAEAETEAGERYDVAAIITRPFDVGDLIEIVRVVAEGEDSTFPPAARRDPKAVQ
jgi:DNA-binding NarL/FixJ family response regulator